MVRLEGVSKVYRTDRIETLALDAIDVDIEEGEFVSVMGPSGCGKTTLLNLMGLLDEPSQGRVLFGGKPIDGYRDRDVARLRNEKVGFVFQEFHLITDLTVLDNVEIPLLYRSLSAGERRKRGARGARPRGAVVARAPLPVAALGWAAAARGHRARDRRPARSDPGGRADGQPRQPDGRRDHEPAARAQLGREDDRGDGHARHAAGRARPSARSVSSTAARSSEAIVLGNYLKVAIKVLLRRKFFTFVSLFGIAFTLLVLIVAAAMLDNTLAPRPPETRLDRILGIERVKLQGPENVSIGEPGLSPARPLRPRSAGRRALLDLDHHVDRDVVRGGPEARIRAATDRRRVLGDPRLRLRRGRTLHAGR